MNDTAASPDNPLVSIALASYNGEKYLAQQLESIIRQDYKNLEIVISDDNSTDRTVEIIESFAVRDPRIRFLPNDGHRGYVKNFMRAFHACHGTLISPSDQDDIWAPDKTRRLVESLGDANLVYCDSRLVDDKNSPLGMNFSDTTEMLTGNDSRSLLLCTSICGHAMMFRSELLKHVGSLENVAYIDWLLSFLAMEHGRVYYLNEVLVNWRQHENSTTFHVRDKKKPLKSKTLETDIQMLKTFSLIGGRHQSFIFDALDRMEKWKASYFNVSMFIFVLCNSHITHKAHPAKIPALKYLLGYKMKKIIRPNHY